MSQPWMPLYGRDERIYIIAADIQSLPVVAIKRGVPFKVGISSTPNKRLKQLQIGCPFRLRFWISDLSSCIGNIATMEKAIHDRLAHLSVGGEWFFGDPDEAYEVACQVNEKEGELAYREWRASNG